MSSMAALVILAAGTIAGPLSDGRAIGQPIAADRCADPGAADGIVVCGRAPGALSPRLPLPDDRRAPGEEVRYAGEARPDPGPSGEPSRLMDTLAKGFRGLRSLVTGEDPNF